MSPDFMQVLTFDSIERTCSRRNLRIDFRVGGVL